MIQKSSILIICFLILLFSSHLTIGSLDVQRHDIILWMARCIVIKSGYQYELSTGTSNTDTDQNFPNVYVPICGILVSGEEVAKISYLKKRPPFIPLFADHASYCDNQPNERSRIRCSNFVLRFWDTEQLMVSCSLSVWDQSPMLELLAKRIGCQPRSVGNLCKSYIGQEVERDVLRKYHEALQHVKPNFLCMSRFEKNQLLQFHQSVLFQVAPDTYPIESELPDHPLPAGTVIHGAAHTHEPAAAGLMPLGP